MKLFAIYIGGEAPGAHIEVHDMRFILAESLEATYPQLRAQWWGTPQSLHLDCWSELTQADGYKVTLKETPSAEAYKLFYVNLGGYDAAHFTEMHKNMFVVAETPVKAKVRALKTIRHWATFHVDDLYEAEQVFCLDQAVLGNQWHVHLEKIDDETPAPFTCRYVKIGTLNNA